MRLFSKNIVLLFVSVLLLISHQSKADEGEVLDPSKEYSFGKELLTKVLEVMDPTDIKTDIALDLQYGPDNEINSLVGTSVEIDFGFKKELSDGIIIPFSYPDPKLSKREKKLTNSLKIQGDGIRARVTLAATKNKEEFTGSIQFYVQKNSKNILSPILIKIENSVVVIAEYELLSAQMILKIPLDSETDHSTTETSYQKQKKLVDGAINCIANSRKQSSIHGKSESSPLSECLFTFNSEGLKRIVLKDSIRTDFEPIEQ